MQEEFINEINKIDDKFFQRLNDSFYKIEDKKYHNYYTYFDDEYTDKDFFNKFPTIFHLRKYLLNNDEKIDIRMVYLAIHHIIKHRGNFLTEGENYSSSDHKLIDEIFKKINSRLNEYANSFIDDEDYFINVTNRDEKFYDELKNILTTDKSKNDKANELKNIFNVNKKTFYSEFVIELLVRGKVNVSNLSPIKNFQHEKKEIIFEKETLNTDIIEASTEIKELSDLILLANDIKLIADHYYLLTILGDAKYFSESMVNIYDNHQKELIELKKLVKKYLSKETYDYFFRAVSQDKNKKYNNYPGYIGMNSTRYHNAKKIERFSHSSYEDFKNELIKEIINPLKKVVKCEEDILKISQIEKKIENSKYLQRQKSGQNSTIPMQLNLMELKKILEIQSKYYPFLNEKVDGLDRITRIIEIFKYHIPYYIGPLSSAHNKFSWIVRSNEQIRPWNIEKVVDYSASATNFITRMQNKCTYLKGTNDYTLPKHSLLYEEYKCLEYVNKLKYEGVLLKVEIKNAIIDEIFKIKEKPTRKDIKEFLKTNYNIITDIPEVNCNMSTFVKFKKIFGIDIVNKYQMVEDIIKDITLFSDKKILEKRLREKHNLDEDKIKVIKSFTLEGYGALSSRFLADFTTYNNETGEYSPTIIELLRKTNLNLQEILYHPDYNFRNAIDEYNKRFVKEDIDYKEFIDEYLYVSPIMKRPLIQTYKIIEEVERIIKRPIDKFYIECTRTNMAKKEVKNSRYEDIKHLYQDVEKLVKDYNIFNVNINKLKEKLDNNKDNLRSDKLYLYFSQLGKCMYTLKDIDIDKLNTHYDIDHIYPQSIIKDDSLSNRVLVDKTYNNEVKNNKFLFEIADSHTKEKINFYDLLLKNKLITVEKHKRLTEKKVTDEQLNGFVNRQLVATNQAVKGLIDLLKLYKKVNEKNIIYSKAKNITLARKKYNLIKSRLANNFHHAHDAYLNVVVGRAINTYYDTNRIYGIADLLRVKDEKSTLNPIVILNRNIYNLRKEKVWDAIETPKLLDTYIYNRHDIHITKRTCTPNEMFKKVTLLPVNKAENAVSIKTTTAAFDTSKYGGITSNAYSFYVIVKYTDKKKKKCIYFRSNSKNCY